MEIKKGTLVMVQKEVSGSPLSLNEIKYIIGLVRGPADDSKDFLVALAGGSLETLAEEAMTPILQTEGEFDFPEEATRTYLPQILATILGRIAGLKRELDLIQFW